jgi:hypothetical protein
MPVALCAIHNFICIHNSHEEEVIAADNGDNHDGRAFNCDHVASALAAAVIVGPSVIWDAIAENIWADYIAIFDKRENEGLHDKGSGSSCDESGHSGDESGSGDGASGDSAE